MRPSTRLPPPQAVHVAQSCCETCASCKLLSVCIERTPLVSKTWEEERVLMLVTEGGPHKREAYRKHHPLEGSSQDLRLNQNTGALQLTCPALSLRFSMIAVKEHIHRQETHGSILTASSSPHLKRCLRRSLQQDGPGLTVTQAQTDQRQDVTEYHKNVSRESTRTLREHK